MAAEVQALPAVLGVDHARVRHPLDQQLLLGGRQSQPGRGRLPGELGGSRDSGRAPGGTGGWARSSARLPSLSLRPQGRPQQRAWPPVPGRAFSRPETCVGPEPEQPGHAAEEPARPEGPSRQVAHPGRSGWQNPAPQPRTRLRCSPLHGPGMLGVSASAALSWGRGRSGLSRHDLIPSPLPRSPSGPSSPPVCPCTRLVPSEHCPQLGPSRPQRPHRQGPGLSLPRHPGDSALDHGAATPRGPRCAASAPPTKV